MFHVKFDAAIVLVEQIGCIGRIDQDRREVAGRDREAARRRQRERRALRRKRISAIERFVSASHWCL